jgi:transcriptional regulator with XRE-family HTH domain
MTLVNYYQNLEDRPETPKQRVRKALMEAFGVTEMTVSRWVNGYIVPARDKWEKISEITGIPVEELFPNKVESEA